MLYWQKECGNQLTLGTDRVSWLVTSITAEPFVSYHRP